MHWPLPLAPRLDWLQVEVSSHCNARCRYCPRTLAGSRWPSRLMDPALFERLRPMLRRTRLVYLQGWGEPFTHPEFFRFVAVARSAGCQVGTTTNGLLLDLERCRQLVRTGVDVVGLSLAGATATTNDHWRDGAPLDRVLGAIDRLAGCRREAGTDRPAIHIAYLLLGAHLDELEQLPALLADRGVDQVVISTLDCLPDPGLRAQALRPRTGDDHLALRARLEAVVEAGRQAGLAVHATLAAPVDAIASRPRCVENVRHAAFLTADGRVAPCVFLGLPAGLNGDAPAGQTLVFQEPLVFGDLEESPFAAIWRSRGHAEFRRAHRDGPLPLPCRTCAKAWSDPPAG